MFENGPEDAGLWIPAFTGRRITRPQGAPTYFAIREARPDYVYRPRVPPPGGTIVFEKGDAVLYALRKP